MNTAKNVRKNVINLNIREKKARTVTFPPLLNSAKAIADKQLRASLETLFNNADDCLFEYADKAANNAQQTSYMDAMRQLRIKKTAMCQAFFGEFEHQFKILLSPQAPPFSAAGYAADSERVDTGLSLVDEDVLEESLAVTNMANRVFSEYREPLAAMIARMNEVYPAKEVSKESNPLSPRIICDAFSKAVACLSTNLEIKLIVYKLFDKFVVRNIGQLYHQINEMFIAAGILPTIKYKMPARKSSSGTAAKPPRKSNAASADVSSNNSPNNSSNNAGSATSGAYASPAQFVPPSAGGNGMEGGNIFDLMRHALSQYRGDQPGQAGFPPSTAYGGSGNAVGSLGGAANLPSSPPNGAPPSGLPGASGASAAGGLPGVAAAAGSTGSAETSPVSGAPGAGAAASPGAPGVTAGPNAHVAGDAPADNAKAGTAAGGGVYYVTSDIIYGLSSIQNSATTASYHEGTQNSGEVIKNKILQAVVQAQGEAHNKTLNGSDADIIDIVSMMFDYILNDKSLPDRTKAVIARLQIPMVKVAILDKSFFNKKNHPARALLNELAYASNVLDSQYDDEDTLYQEVERIVERVLRDFHSNIELFDELLAEFLEFQAREVEANRLAEQMILDAKQTVADEIEKRLHKHKVPESVAQFVLGPWKDVMTTIGIRDQCEGIAWNSATTFLDDLIWSVQPKLFSDERRQLTMVIPRILPALRDGMALLERNDYNLTQFLEELQKLHLRALQADKPHGNTNAKSKQSAAEPIEQDPLVDNAHSAHKAASIMDELMDDIILQGDKHDSYQFDVADPQLMQSEFFHTVRNMELGTWVEFIGAEGSQRGKLTWKCEFTGEYTFMNRLYKVVADIGMRDLINRLEESSALIAEDTPLFDRAISAIVSSMKNMTGNSKNTHTAVN